MCSYSINLMFSPEKDYFSNYWNPKIMNITPFLNNSKESTFELIEQFSKNQKIQNPAYTILIIAYTILIIFGTFGNSLVVFAVAGNPLMRTERNIFILNLAISDLLLCLITMPLTLMEILCKYWPLGQHVFFCKMIGLMQGVNIFLSTISITAIAWDRYHVIVYPTQKNVQFRNIIKILTIMWSLALLLSSPMLIIKELVHYDIPLTQYGINSVDYCIEDWPVKHGRFYYSIFTMFCQYLLPILIVSTSYFEICNKLKNRMHSTFALHRKTEQNIERSRRVKRTNYLLASIAIIFGISWLPLNIFNLYADICFSENEMNQKVFIIYAACHMMGMSSACSNPVLYGWLNKNFRKEFEKYLLCKRIESNHLEKAISNSKRTDILETCQVKNQIVKKHQITTNPTILTE